MKKKMLFNTYTKKLKNLENISNYNMKAILYIDLDNFPIKESYQHTLTDLNENYDIRFLSKKIFGEMELLKNLQLDIQQSHVLIPCPKLTKYKNGTDIKLTIEIMKDLFTNKSVDTFIIASADTDYIPVIKEIKEQGKEVILLKDKNTHLNSVLKETADQVIECDSNKSDNIYKSRLIINNIIDILFTRNNNGSGTYNISTINDHLMKHKYYYKDYGFKTFKHTMITCIDSKKYKLDFNTELIRKL
jgi:uncharacterized LabA/DUF88 family protein